MPPRIGPYSLERKLGSGGMGTVYLGVHDETGEKAAVKILPAALARETGFRERFAREIETVRRLTNPHIAGHLASGAVDKNGEPLSPDVEPGDDATAFLALQYVEGETLLMRLRRERRLPWRAVVDLGVQVCTALKAAHDAGVVHRDLKPSNLILTPSDAGANGGVGHVTLVDFGVAQLFAAGRLTQTGGVIGTPEFMAPEQASGKRVDKKCDLYSLGAVLYACLCGVPPFRGKSAVDVLQQHRFGQFDKPRRYVPDCPPPVEATICDLLAKAPADRPGDARVVSNRLSAAVRREDYAGDGSQAESNGRQPGDPDSRPGVSGDQFAPVAERPTRAAGDGQVEDDEANDAALFTETGVTNLGDETVALSRSGGASAEAREENLAFPREGPGPATIARNGVIRALQETDEQGPVVRFFEQTWVLVSALAILIAGGVWWFESRASPLPPPGEMTVGQHLAAARAALEQPAGAVWTRARDRHLTPLLAPGGIDQIERKSRDADNPAAPLAPAAREYTVKQAQGLADRVRRYEIETDARRPTLAEPPRDESERFLRLAAHQTATGDRPAAARTLQAFLDATATDDPPRRLAQNRRIAELMLTDLAVPPRIGPALAGAAIEEAKRAAETGDRRRAQRILSGLMALYADDPAAESMLKEARAALRPLEEPADDEAALSKDDEPPAESLEDSPAAG
ncbi:MAG: serine/threonine-protein kinase [Planctomycetota bacterium]